VPLTRTTEWSAGEATENVRPGSAQTLIGTRQRVWVGLSLALLRSLSGVLTYALLLDKRRLCAGDITSTASLAAAQRRTGAFLRKLLDWNMTLSPYRPVPTTPVPFVHLEQLCAGDRTGSGALGTDMDVLVTVPRLTGWCPRQ